MSEFIKKLNSSELVSKAWDEIDRDQANAGLLIDTISNEFKDWQPPKPPVIVPQFVADFIKAIRIKGVKPLMDSVTFGEIGFTEEKRDEILHWINEHQEEYMRAWLDDYTVEKEQMYYLKNKNTGHILYRQPKEAGGDFIEVVATINEEYTWFTQDEIDTMHIGSYEQIAVKVDEVEP